ncbi:hypothetical protein HAX54_009963 [Datura stramonium]|uniref:Senescence regulator n=1 Tax=Datura stramonium TaxID=4076 RepID=A0ABS8TFJ9_DATST|nr:hypothetical protein [Datura stramonium]
MATRKNFLFLGAKDQRISAISSNDLQFEFDESDTIWGNTNSSPDEINIESKRLIPSSRFSKKTAKKCAPAAATSLPVSVPDWSKILGKEYSNVCVHDNIRDKEEVDEDNRIPPHEYLARTRVASFSVQEGIGRTLKGRDLSRVRNAIWKQIGFED